MRTKRKKKVAVTCCCCIDSVLLWPGCVWHWLVAGNGDLTSSCSCRRRLWIGSSQSQRFVACCVSALHHWTSARSRRTSSLLWLHLLLWPRICRHAVSCWFPRLRCVAAVLSNCLWAVQERVLLSCSSCSWFVGVRVDFGCMIFGRCCCWWWWWVLWCADISWLRGWWWTSSCQRWLWLWQPCDGLSLPTNKRTVKATHSCELSGVKKFPCFRLPSVPKKRSPFLTF